MSQRDYVHTDDAGGGIVIHWDSETVCTPAYA